MPACGRGRGACRRAGRRRRSAICIRFPRRSWSPIRTSSRTPATERVRVRRRPSGLRLTACVLALALESGACSSDPLPSGTPAPPPVRPTLDPTYRPTGRGAAGDVFVHLFEWKWTDIARECEAVLGPHGFKAVQVSPPQEHILAAGFPWWQRYQPVSYSIDRSRSGTRAQFVDMVQRCRSGGRGHLRRRRHQPHDRGRRAREATARRTRSTSIRDSTPRPTSTRRAA